MTATVTPLHEFEHTHLSKRTFKEIIESAIGSPEDELLIIADSESAATSIQSDLENRLQASIPQQRVLTMDDPLDIDTDTADVTVLSDPPNDLFRCHPPLYEATTVTKPGGTIIYRSTHRLAHSDAVEIESIHSVEWHKFAKPALIAKLTVTAAGDYGSGQTKSAEHENAEEQATRPTTLSAYQK